MIRVFPGLVSILLLIALFTGFQGGRYYLGNTLQELGILSSICLYLIGSYLSIYHLPRKEWQCWFYAPLVLTALIMVVWGTLFSARFGGNPLFNIMASREFMFIFLAPGIYFCLRAGYSFKTLTGVVWICLLVLMCNYLYNSFTMDLQATFFSPDSRISNLVTYDEWRGFRLKPTLFALMLMLLYSLITLLQNRSLTKKMVAVLVIGLGCYIWTLVQARSTLATLILAVCCYPLFMSRPNRLHLVIFSIPLFILFMPVLVNILGTYFGSADGGDVRIDSYRLALAEIPSRLFLGVGEDSAKGPTYQMLFGPKFYPSDLGIVGIAFKYGLIGTTLYLVIHFAILQKLWKANWAWRDAAGKLQPLLWALLVFMCAQTFNLILNPGLAYVQGITVGALAAALSAYVLNRKMRQNCSF